MKTRKAIALPVAALILIAVVGAVWLIAAGYAETAIGTLIRWGEDGTLTAFEEVMMNRVIPMLAGFFTAAVGLYLAAKKMFRAVERAKTQMDAATGEAVKTYEEHEAMNKRLEAFMKEERSAAEAQRQAMREEFAAMAREQRTSLAADRATVKRIEGKVDGMRSATKAAFGATGELVKNGTATRVAYLLAETEGEDISAEKEGGGDDEAVGDDGEAVEETEAHW